MVQVLIHSPKKFCLMTSNGIPGILRIIPTAGTCRSDYHRHRSVAVLFQESYRRLDCMRQVALGKMQKFSFGTSVGVAQLDSTSFV